MRSRSSFGFEYAGLVRTRRRRAARGRPRDVEAPKTRRRVMATLLSAMAASPARAAGEEPGWTFTLDPYAFVPIGVTGELTAGDVTVLFDADLSDLLDKLRFAFAARGEAWGDRWGLILDAQSMRTGARSAGSSSETTQPSSPR